MTQLEARRQSLRELVVHHYYYDTFDFLGQRLWDATVASFASVSSFTGSTSVEPSLFSSPTMRSHSRGKLIK